MKNFHGLRLIVPIIAALTLAACDGGDTDKVAEAVAPAPAFGANVRLIELVEADFVVTSTTVAQTKFAKPLVVSATKLNELTGAWQYRSHLSKENFVGVHAWASRSNVSMQLVDIGTVSFRDDGTYASSGGTAARVIGGARELVLQYTVEENGDWHIVGDQLTMQVRTWQPLPGDAQSADYLPNGKRPMFADLTGRTHVFDIVYDDDGSVDLQAVEFLPNAEIELVRLDVEAAR